MGGAKCLFSATIPCVVTDTPAMPLRRRDGARGVSATTTPGVRCSTPARPEIADTAAMVDKSAATGMSPCRLGSITCAPANVRRAVVHEDPRDPASAVRPVASPPLSIRSAITKGVTVSMSAHTSCADARSVNQRDVRWVPSPDIRRSSIARSVPLSTTSSRGFSGNVLETPDTSTRYTPGIKPAKMTRPSLAKPTAAAAGG